jgi:hypothetical protein
MAGTSGTSGAPIVAGEPGQRARWRCPDCGRAFARRNQPHSCKRVPIEAHFAPDGASRRLFEALLAAVGGHVGPCEVVSLPCCIHLAATDDFLAVLPRRDRLEIRFTVHRRIRSPRIQACAQTSRDAYKHRVDISAVEDLDPELLGWLREAYRGRHG